MPITVEHTIQSVGLLPIGMVNIPWLLRSWEGECERTMKVTSITEVIASI